MLGELVYCSGGDGKLRRQERYGLTVLRVEVRPGGWGEAGRLKRVFRRMSRFGVRRVLVPGNFRHGELLLRWGLEPVDPVPFLRACAGSLALAALRREGIMPQQGTVSLRGRRVERDMVRAAEFLCPRVRDVAVAAPVGGGDLAAWLRREFGAPIRPDSGEIPVAVRFDGTGAMEGRRVLSLFGSEPGLAGICLRAAALAPEDQEKLPLMASLWEAGRGDRLGLEFT
ncbi:MAG: hypothetical protein KH028_03600 [Oscillospiraceae bacterium]|jgi:hypothetical protein|nr:hypothetical protein [Oscillospiraceae bacterium]